MAKKSKFPDAGFSVLNIESTKSIKLDKDKATTAIKNKLPRPTMTLKEFVDKKYPQITEQKYDTYLCTIKDIALMPFELDIYETRIVLVEVTGKKVKDSDGSMIPERIYKGRDYTMGGAIQYVGSILAKRQIQALDSRILTLKEYAKIFFKYNRYVSGIINKHFQEALKEMEKEFDLESMSADSKPEWIATYPPASKIK